MNIPSIGESTSIHALANQDSSLLDDIRHVALSPDTAHAVNDVMRGTLEAVQAAGPAVAGATAITLSTVAAVDQLRRKGVVNTLAWRSYRPQPESGTKHPRGLKHKLRVGVLAAGLSVRAAVPMAAVATIFGLEKAVRNGQLSVLDTITKDAGMKGDDYIITQGADTPMDSSVVPSSVEETVNGVGFYVGLPKVSGGDGRTDGLMFSSPLLPKETVKTTGLSGFFPDKKIRINGVTVEAEELDRDNASMQRDTLIVSNDIARKVMHLEDGEGAYWGVFVPSEDKTQEDLQRELNMKYGLDSYRVLTVDELEDGTESFMSRNGTGVLTIAGIAAALGGMVAVVSAERQNIEKKKKQISTLRQIGATKYDVGAPEVQALTYRLLGALPIGLVAAKFAEAGANGITPGLGSNLGVKELAGAFTIISAPAIGATIKAVRDAVKANPVELMRDAQSV